MPIHDKLASTMSLARMLRQGLDGCAVETKIQTSTLALLLDTLIDLGVAQPAIRHDENLRKTVAGVVRSFGAAGKG